MVTGNADSAAKTPTDFQLNSYRVDLTSGGVQQSSVQCEDLEDVCGGIARAYKLLEDCPIDDAYDPAATLIMNLGLLSGTHFMTGLRTYFHAYSPLKQSLSGKPSAMWSAGSGKFGTKLRYLGIDEVFFTGRCAGPTLLHIHRDGGGDGHKADGEETPGTDAPVKFSFLDASDLVGLHVNDRMQKLHGRFPDAHFAVIGPSGENYENVRYAAIALSTENQLKSGDNKGRYCGRGGMGGVMGSKNLIGIVADTPDVHAGKAPAAMKAINLEVARGKGSARFRDKDKHNGQGGTWANVAALNPVHAMPEMNFAPTGTTVSLPLHRDNFEQGPYDVKDESCFRCGISCHKNVYDLEDGERGKFRAKLDFEPLVLLSSNIGIFAADEILELVELVDQLSMDSISIGGCLAYAMEYNRRHPDAPIADGITYGDYKTTRSVIEKIGAGQMEQLGQGVMRLSMQLNEPGYAMHSKGVEYPAYLPQTNPGYPWALAGGHMSMRTYLLLLNEKETSVDYWVDAITNRGLAILRDDFLGICKFSGMPDDQVAEAIEAIHGLSLKPGDLQRLIRRAFLRGYRLERRHGFTDDDYNMPDESHDEYPQIELPHFNTREFFNELKPKVMARFAEMAVDEGLN